MAYQFVRSRDLIEKYRKDNPEVESMLWLDILNEAINSIGVEVISVGYDAIGEPMTLLLRIESSASSS